MSKDWRAERRGSAIGMYESGMTQREIAEVLNVSAMAVNKWLRAYRDAGVAGLCSRPHVGAKARLSAAQMQLLPDHLSHGAEAYGFRGDVWTCARVGHVIKQEFDVQFSKSHVSRLLKGLKWTPQRPIERARQRDEVAITDWRNRVWPDLKKRLHWNGENCFSWMRAASTSYRDVCAPMRQWDAHRSCQFFRPVTIYQ
mgnify:CR=1 FL=1